jgi:hypothetical protein
MRWLFSVALAGCIHTIEEHESRVGDIVRDCVVPVPDGVVALGAPVSIELPDASLWIWESLTLTDGSTVANAAARMPRSGDACAEPPELAMNPARSPADVSGRDLRVAEHDVAHAAGERDVARAGERDVARAGERDVAHAAGPIRSVLALSVDEQAENAARTDGRRLALVPTGGFAHDGLAYLYYDHVLRGPGFFETQIAGTGLCVLAPTSADACERIAEGASTILWRPDERVLNRGGFVVDEPDGPRALIAGCREVGSFDEPCTLAGVSTAEVRDPHAYRVWNAFDGWVDPLTDASELTNTIGSLTIAPFDEGTFIATQLELFDNRVVVQISKLPEQDYEHRVHAFDVLPPADGTWFVSGGREHVGLRRDAASIVVSYATDNPAAPGLHLVDFRFYGVPE